MILSEFDFDQLEEVYRNIVGIFDFLFGGFGLVFKFFIFLKLKFFLSFKNLFVDVQDVVGEVECQYVQYIVFDMLWKIWDGVM